MRQMMALPALTDADRAVLKALLTPIFRQPIGVRSPNPPA